MKKCIDCKQVKPLEQFSLRNNYNKSATIYRKSQCRSCDCSRFKNWVKNNRERYLAYQRQYKRLCKQN